jgi:hypothetical protein
VVVAGKVLLSQFESERRRGFYFGGGARNEKRDEIQFQ